MPPAALQTVDVALRDGGTVRVRPVRRDDEAALYDFLDELSDDSRWLRFFTAAANLRSAHDFTAMGDGRARGLVAVTGDPERIVAHAAYIRETGERAEVAFEVADEWQGRGIATVLLGHLVELAQTDGIATFTATVLAGNHRMIKVFRDSGFTVDVRTVPGELQIEMPADLAPEARERFEDRERIAADAAVSHVLRPSSIALIGVSKRPGSVGAAVLGNVLAVGYQGRLCVVHPRGESFPGVETHASIAEVPWPVELAVIALPAERVVAVARECGAAGVRASSCSPPASPRSADPEWLARPNCCRCAARRACGLSGRTASACSTRRPTSL